VYILSVFKHFTLGYFRLKVAFRRKVKWHLFGKMEQTCSVYNLERKSTLNATEIIEVSPNICTEVWDPRAEKVIPHAFQARHIFRVKNVILEPGQGLIYSSEGKLLSESTVWQDDRVYQSFPWIAKKRKANARRFNSDDLAFITSNSFYHWLIEDLPQLIIILEHFPNTQILKRIDSPGYVTDFLTLLNLDVIDLGSPVFLGELLFVSRGKDSGWPLGLDLERLRQHEVIKSHINQSPSRKGVYISRKNSTRSPKNEIAVENLFQEFGFEVHYLEDMSLVEQIKLISSTQFLAGVHGAGLTHLIWMPEGSSVIDIATDSYWTECFHRLASLRNLDYFPFVREGSHNQEIDLLKLEEFLKIILNTEVKR
jgi:hypothetical protein